jgi:ribose/xylose/arabinose/galactoside ABC-type transport system permease subunit
MSTAATTASVRASRRPRIEMRYAAVWIALALTLLAGLLFSSGTVSWGQMPVLLRQAAPLGMLALGQTIVIIGRGFDLSVGGVVAFVNVVAAGGFTAGLPGALVALICLLIGAGIGAINGMLIAWIRVPALVATLGMAFVLTGATLIYSGGQPSGQIPESIRSLSTERLLGLPLGVWLWILIGLALALALRYTWPGRHLYARGESPTAARLAGVRIELVDVCAYTASGVLAAGGGLLLAGYVGTGTLGAGQDLLLGSLAAAVIGGATFEGGRGRLTGAMAGAFLLTVLTAILTGVGAGAEGSLIVQGVVLLGAASLFRTKRLDHRAS